MELGIKEKKNGRALYDARTDYQKENEELDMIYDRPSPERKTAAVYAAVTAGCFLFARIYGLFSHGISSDYMTYLFLVPLVLGWMPALAGWLLGGRLKEAEAQEPEAAQDEEGGLSEPLWHAGVAAVTVSFLLRGILEIAGTASVYQRFLTGAGLAMLAVAVALMAADALKSGRRSA